MTLPPHPAYRIEGPALVSFSGGRTSGYMLHEIVRAYDGKLPENVHVCFANTGKEREETLRFVHECGKRWGVRIVWLEWRDTEAGFEIVGYNEASRDGEPFAALIAKKNFLPTAVTRYCTQMLKIRVMRDYMRSLGYERWENAVGLRYDEGHRVLKALARNDENKERFKVALPLSKAKVVKADVMTFWSGQPFDLGLANHEGNCDLCFMKAKGKLLSLVRDVPGRAKWWIGQERIVTPTKPSGARFGDFSYADLAVRARDQGHLFDEPIDPDEFDAECGLWCEPAAFAETTV